MLYGIGGWLGLQLAVPPGYATMIWPASGIAVAALLIFGRALWPGVMIGALVVNLIAGGAISAGTVDTLAVINAVIIAAGSTAQAIFAATIVRRRFGVPLDIRNGQALLELVLLCGPVACLISASVGVATLTVNGVIPPAAAFDNWLTWWFGNILGIAIVLPIALLSPWRHWSMHWRGNPIASLTATMVAGLFILLGTTLVAWKTTSLATYQHNQEAFAALAAESEKALRYRLESYKQSLDSGAALFGASNHVSTDEWQTFVETLNIGSTLPGINGLGYIVPVKKDGLDQYQRKLVYDGVTDLEIHPVTKRDEFFVITYIEPIATNREAVGLDIAFEHNRREAAVRARDSGKATVTKRIFLVQDHNRTPGFLLLRPIYATRHIPHSVAARRAAFKGWVYAPFIANRFMEGMTDSQGKTLDIRIVDGASAISDELIYSSDQQGGKTAEYSVSKTVSLMQQQWTITWTSTELFEQSALNKEPWLVLGSGLAITLIFGILLLSYTRQEAYVRRQVGIKTRDLIDREHGLTEALAALEKSERRFSALAGLSPAGIFRTDGYGFCNFVNDAWLEATGLKVNEVMGAGWISAVHIDDRDRVHRAWLSTIASGKKLRIEFRFSTRNNAINWIDFMCGPETDDDGEVIGFIGVGVNISDRKHLEEEMEAARDRAEQATRTKSNFLANMSHEIRTPMNGVTGFAELLLQDDLTADQRNKLDLILDSSNSMMRLLNDILDFSKIEAGQMRIAAAPLNLEAKLRKCVRALEPLAQKKNLDIFVGIAPDLPQWISADPLRLRQIIMNLLGNAIKFTDEGQISVRATQDSNDNLLIEVQDSGIGIAVDRQSAIFEQFVQADDSSARKHGGSGLGLAISYQLARLMGGGLSLKSQTNIGTTLSLTLPLIASAAAEQLPPAASTPQPIADVPARILLAEDHDINQILLRDMLARFGYSADLACNGKEAVDMVLQARAEGNGYDLVLMDIQMPLVDGLEATRQIRAAAIEPEELPIVALSANAYPEDVEQCLQAGMQAHVAKPVRVDDFGPMLNRWLVKRAPANANGPAANMVANTNMMDTLQRKYEQRKQDIFTYIAEIMGQSSVEAEHIQQLRTMLHKLAGTAAMFGDEELGQCASAIEHDMATWKPEDRVRRVQEARQKMMACQKPIDDADSVRVRTLNGLRDLPS